MTTEELVTLVTRRVKDVNLEIASQAARFGLSPEQMSDTVAAAIFGLGTTMMFESGYDEAEIVEIVRHLVGNLSAPPSARGAS